MICPKKPNTNRKGPVPMLRLLADGDIERVMDQAKEKLFLLGVNLHYVVGQHSAPVLRAARDRGVATTIYLLDQQSQLAKDFYSEEGSRDRLRDTKAQTYARLRETQQQLTSMHRELRNVGRADRLKVWLYKYVSMYTMIAVDPESAAGRMIISPHLHSVEAKFPPLFELTRESNADLIDVYWKDFTQFVERVEKRPMPFDEA